MPDALDIVIVSFNTREVLADCVRAIDAVPPARSHHVVVVDNGSTDGSAERLRAEFPRVQVEALDRNLGFAAATNVGIRATSAPLILMLNSDTVAPAGAIDALCERLEITGAVAAGPRLVDRHQHPEVSFGRRLTPWTEAMQAARVALSASDSAIARRYIAHLTSRERFVNWVSGACLLVRRGPAEAVGLLDERYFMYEEDVDFCAALGVAGGRVLFTPRATVVHLRGASGQPASGAAPACYDASHLAFYAKHHPRWVPALRWWQRRK